MKFFARLFATFAVLITLLFSVPTFAQTTSSFSLHSVNVMGYYQDQGGFSRLNTNAFVYDDAGSHIQQGEFAISAPFVRFNSLALNVAVLTPLRAVVNYDGLYWPSTPSQGDGIPATLTFTADNTLKFFVLIVAKANKAVLYKYTGAFQSASIVLK